jgi:hypothetical protein
MSMHPNFDRESFQTLLASAFAVQESGIDTQSLSALVEVQELIATGSFDFSGVLDLIADRARIVAGATGVAIGLLKANQLVYLAGSGSAAKYVGQHVTAVLSVSAHKGGRKEILRVENAEPDPRIEAAICRHRDAKALLIIPIYRERAVAGVMEVLFGDPHVFQDREMRTYWVMASLVEEAVPRDNPLSQKRSLATQPPTDLHSIGQTGFQTQKVYSDDTPVLTPSIVQACGVAAEAPVKVSALRPAAKVAAIKEPLRHVFLDNLQLNVAAAVLVIALGLVSWVVLDHQRVPSMKDSALTRSNTLGQHVLQPLPKPSPASASKPHNPAGGTQSEKATRSAFKRVRVGPNEVDYIAEDVTIRRFMVNTTPSHVPDPNRQLNIGDDVTVRYFAYKPEIVPQKLPRSTATQSVQSSMPDSK